MLMASKPDVVEGAQPLGYRTVREKGKTQKVPRLWAARWIGKNYRYVRSNAKNLASTTSHASPIAHWRRGHWHTYKTGKGRQIDELKWIEPVLVNANKMD